MENLAGDLLLGLKFVKLSILPTLHTICLGQVGRIEMTIYLGFKGLNAIFFHVASSMQQSRLKKSKIFKNKR